MSLKGIGYYFERCVCGAFAFYYLNFYECVRIFYVFFNSLPESVYVDDAGFSRLKMNDQDVCSVRMMLCNPLS